jgi:hypothetical protein
VRFRRAGKTIDPGGTTVPGGASRVPIILVILAGMVGIAIVAYFGLRGGKREPAPLTRDATPKAPVVSAGVTPDVAPTPTAQGSATATPGAGQVATTLEAALRKQRLWSTVAVVGNHADVRSGSCSDPGMAAALDRVAAAFKAAGLTKLRCLEQSGHVVLSRDL